MSVEDVTINAQVRRVFAQHWIDVTHVSHRTVRGHVYVGGRIAALADNNPDADTGLMQRLHEGILAVEGVTGVEYSLENWLFDGMTWKLVGAAKQRYERQKEKERARRQALQELAGSEAEQSAKQK